MIFILWAKLGVVASGVVCSTFFIGHIQFPSPETVFDVDPKKNFQKILPVLISLETKVQNYNEY